MSGIMALLSLDGRPLAEGLARAQLAAIAHRGDREPRLWLGEGVALGHAHRPATPEAEREALPGADRTGRYWLVWDGRLDNRAGLAQALGVAPAAAQEWTDADYLLAAYARWGEDCVQRLLGDWAVVIWDTVSRRLFCAVDPVGWRQLYYAVAGGVLAVGSEPQQLLAGSLVPRAVNHDYLLRYLADAVQVPEETCYAGVRALEGGRSLTCTAGTVGLTVRTYWAGPRAATLPFHRPEEYVEAFSAVFREAMRARLRSSRRVGVLLSGGLDSSYVAACAAREGAEVIALSGYAPGTRWMDERRYARLAAGHLGLPLVEVDIGDCWALSGRWLADGVFDQPEHAPQSASHLRLARAAREAGLGVLLSGDGGDEWLTGSTACIGDALLRGRLDAAWRLTQRTRGRSATPARLARACLRDLAPLAVQDRLARLRGRPAVTGFAPAVAPQPGWVSVPAFSRVTAWQRRRALEVDRRLYGQMARPLVLWRERHVLAPHGLELRTPFNDARVIELMAATPEWVKWYRGRPKDLLRAAEAPLLPRAIPDRAGAGYYTELLEAGVRVHERGRVRRAVDAVAALPGVRGDAARHEVAHWTATGHRWWAPPWRLITAGLWLRAPAASSPAAVPPVER